MAGPPLINTDPCIVQLWPGTTNMIPSTEYVANGGIYWSNTCVILLY